MSTKTGTQTSCDVVHKRSRGHAPRGFAAGPAILLCAIFFAGGQPGRAATLEQVESRQAAAETAKAAMLSPSLYLRGVQALERAREREGDERQQAIDAAWQAFDGALASAARARGVLGETLEARDSANEAEAFKLAPQDWEQAEKKLNNAVRALERDKLERAMDSAAEATALYQRAGVNALQARYLGTARAALRDAEQAGAAKLAPRSFAQAEERLARAEARLEKDRRTSPAVATLATDAIYSARVATQIASQAQQVRAKEATVEDLILARQDYLASLAAAAGVEADFSQGSATLEAELLAELERVPVLKTELEESQRRAAGLEEELRDVDRRLRNVSAERRNLMRVVQANLRTREQFEQVEAQFTRNEAKVLRDGENIVLRMVGLQFASGSATLDDTARALLDRTQNVLSMFPRAQVRVEGHTDSSGGAQANQELSRDRARAVADYLVQGAGLQEFRVTAMGYGDTRPLTSNRTADGRAMNRRIDIVIVNRPEDGL